MTPPPAHATGCGVVELRRYALRAGARETLIELFEREFVETQEAVGMQVLGTFRDEDDPDSFVWLRGFADMSARPQALQGFYGGPVWAEHGRAANATMIDSDNVLLLRPLDEQSRLPLDPARRAPADSPGAARGGSVVVTICPVEPSWSDRLRSLFELEVEPVLRRAGAGVRATFATEHAQNNFPALPVREGEEFFVWLSQFENAAARDAHLGRIDLHALFAGLLAGEPEIVRLQPTGRSLLPDA